MSDPSSAAALLAGPEGQLLTTHFLSRPALQLAPALVGRWLVRALPEQPEPLVVQITEVEAYVWPADSANHCFRGRTARNAVMFGPPGHAYVYVCYGVHHMLNIVSDREGQGAAVLIRAAQPILGAAHIAERRGGRAGPDSLAGPGKLCEALALDLGFNGAPIYTADSALSLRAGRPPAQLRRGPRVGIHSASPEDQAALWRFAQPDTRWVSHARTLGAAEDWPPPPEEGVQPG